MSFTVDPRALECIRALSEARAPSGFEDEAIAAARRFVPGGYTVTEDCIRNLYLHRKANTGTKPVLMLDAHADEVGMMVHSIHPNGTLRFVTLGGWNPASLPAARVLVRNRHGEFIRGMIAAKPSHFMTEAERKALPAVRDLVIDIGACSAQEAQEVFGVRIGEPVVADTPFYYDEKHDLIHGKGFDCRIGCAALLEALRRLENEELAVDIVGVLSAQEEVGERGVRVAVEKVKPDIAICFEGCPADDTFTPEYAIQTALKKGPMLRFMDTSVICSPRYQRWALELGEANGIPVQASVREGGGNNGAFINVAAGGVPVVVTGVPVRYIHTPAGMTSYRDFESTVQLTVAMAKALNRDIIAGF